MPLAERIEQFKISEKYLQPEPEKSYHDGSISIHVVNQDPKLPYWFRQEHPWVFGWSQQRLYAYADGTLELPLAIHGSAYDRQEYQHVTLSLKKKSAIRLMQALKETLDRIEEQERELIRHEQEWQSLNPIGYAMRKMFGPAIGIYEAPLN